MVGEVNIEKLMPKIVASLDKLLSKTDFDSLTVKAIAEDVGISRCFGKDTLLFKSCSSEESNKLSFVNFFKTSRASYLCFVNCKDERASVAVEVVPVHIDCSIKDFQNVIAGIPVGNFS